MHSSHTCLCFHNFGDVFVTTVPPLQADTTDTEYKEADGGPQEFMDLLEGPEVRQRAQSIASVITSTMEGRQAGRSRVRC